MEPVSPELALIDPALAERARLLLPQPVDTLARLDALALTSRMSSMAQRATDMSVRGVPDVRGDRRSLARPRKRRSAALAGALAAGALVVALLVGVRVDLRGSPAGADTAPLVEPPVSSITETSPGPAETQPPTPVGPRAGEPAPQRFAWAPAPGAGAYHVELFRGSSKVFEADTKRPAITIPAQWTFGGRTRSLDPAEYRWNVWPVFAGQRAARAIVQARFVAPAR